MTSQGFGSMPMRWYNINVQQKCLSWITSDYTAHLHTTVSVRREYHLSDLLMWITMASVFDSVFFSWDSLRVILILGVCLEKYTFNQTFRIYFTTFGSINYPSCSYYQASRLDFFRISWVPGGQSWLYKKASKTDVIQDVSRMWSMSWMFLFAEVPLVMRTEW